MNFHLLYTENGTIKLASFQTKDQRHLFIGAFTLANLDNPEDNQVEMAFEGEVTHTSPSILRGL